MKFKSFTWKCALEKSSHTCQTFTHCRWCKHKCNQWRSEVQKYRNVFSEKRKSVVDVHEECMIFYLYHTCHDFSMCYLKDVEKRDVKSLRWCWTIL